MQVDKKEKTKTTCHFIMRDNTVDIWVKYFSVLFCLFLTPQQGASKFIFLVFLVLALGWPPRNHCGWEDRQALSKP